MKKSGHKFLLTGHNIIQISDEFDIITGCSIPEIINQLRPGDPVLVDDGMIEGEVESISERGAVMGSEAECMMLNKGNYLPDGVKALDDILQKMQAHQYKKTPRLRALAIANSSLPI